MPPTGEGTHFNAKRIVSRIWLWVILAIAAYLLCQHFIRVKKMDNMNARMELEKQSYTQQLDDIKQFHKQQLDDIDRDLANGLLTYHEARERIQKSSDEARERVDKAGAEFRRRTERIEDMYSPPGK